MRAKALNAQNISFLILKWLHFFLLGKKRLASAQKRFIQYRVAKNVTILSIVIYRVAKKKRGQHD